MISPADEPRHGTGAPAPHPKTVRLSLSEINALCFKAARGAGLAWGEAEEAGWAASWLSRAGLPGPSLTLAWLTGVADLARPVPAPGRWSAASGAQCPLRCGIALADFAGLPEGPGADPLAIARVASPLMLVPFVARAAARTGSVLRLRWGRSEAVLDAATTPLSLDATGDTDAQDVDLLIERVDPREARDISRTAVPPSSGVNPADWRALDTLALNITVPASAQSRAGAGAAGSDND